MCPPCHHPGEGRSPPAPGQGEQGGVGGDATVSRSTPEQGVLRCWSRGWPGVSAARGDENGAAKAAYGI